MKKQIWMVILVCLLVACTPRRISGAAQVAVVPDPLKNHLYQALSLMPENANYVEFTDWSLIKKKEGFEDLSSADDWDKRMDFYLTIAGKYAMPSFFALKGLERHSELWGWDSSDLEWEVRSSVNLPPNYALKFQEGFDVAPVIVSLEDHGLTKETYQGISIYSTKLDGAALAWVGTTEFSITNTAVIAEANLLLMSIDHDHLLSMINVFQDKSDSLADRQSIQELIASLEGSPGAFISGDVCSLLGSQALIDELAFDPMKDTKQREFRRQLDRRPQLESYDALGIGYRVDGPEPVGILIMQFSDPEEARKDLKSRQQLAETGLTRGENPQSYTEVFFSLSGDATVQGNQIVMEVVPAENKPARLFQMLWTRDVIFATCP